MFTMNLNLIAYSPVPSRDLSRLVGSIVFGNWKSYVLIVARSFHKCMFSLARRFGRRTRRVTIRGVIFSHHRSRSPRWVFFSQASTLRAWRKRWGTKPPKRFRCCTHIATLPAVTSYINLASSRTAYVQYYSATSSSRFGSEIGVNHAEYSTVSRFSRSSLVIRTIHFPNLNGCITVV